jgi:hypothetical protein
MGSKVQLKGMEPKNEILCKKITFGSFYMELEVIFTIIQQTYSKTCNKFYE